MAMAEDEHVARLYQQIEFAKGCLESAREGGDYFPASDEDYVHAAIALHLTVLELTDACLQLAHVRRGTAVPIIARSLFEAAVDLRNLLLDPGYVDRLHAANAEQMLSLTTGNMSRQFLGNLLDVPDVTAEIRRLEELLAKLKREGKGAWTIKKKCKRIGALGYYEGTYRLLCLDTHSNLAALAERHMAPAGEGVLFTVFGETDTVALRLRIGMVTELAVESITGTHAAFRTGHAPCLGMRERFLGARSDLMAGLDSDGGRFAAAEAAEQAC